MTISRRDTRACAALPAVVLTLGAWLATATLVATQTQTPQAPSARPAAAKLPPLSWTCPMHPEVIDTQAGECPRCKMKLVPIRLAVVWSCQMHQEVTKTEKGPCPICKMDMIRVIKTVSFSCPAHPKVNEANPGTCPTDKRPLVATYTCLLYTSPSPRD